MAQKVVVGLSGGVDSSVAAYLLLQQGYEVIGMFMKNWHDTDVTISDDCPWEEDSKDALMVAEALGIPFQTIDLSAEYKSRIVDYMFAEYKAGRTPNPDILCNREIKFDLFLKAAEKLGADFVATGHYCRKEAVVVDGEVMYRLLSGMDSSKDQSYFLCQVSQDQLRKTLFPIGHLQKSRVRAIATEQSLVTADKKDSQGLCFIGKVRLPDFLQQQLKPKKGPIIEIPAEAAIYQPQKVVAGVEIGLNAIAEPFHYQHDMGRLVGEHQGAHYFTVGQRKGLGVGGKEEPLFVIATDVTTNTVYVGMGDDHPGLYRSALFIPDSDVHWVRPDMEIQTGETMKVKARIRYRQTLQDAELVHMSEGIYLSFNHPQRGITPGQFAAWYLEDELIGSGVIEK